MNKYKHILFDLDRTLFDFDAAEKYSFFEAFRSEGINVNDEIFTAYKKINHELWNMYSNGKVSLEFVRENRFAQLFSFAHFQPDCETWGGSLPKQINYTSLNRKFSEYLSSCNQLIPGSFDLCKKLSANHTLSIVTNGVTEIQNNRINKSLINDLFSFIFISEEIGVQKPDIRFFNHVLSILEIRNPSQVLIIGDSLVSDIKGGNDANIHTCWFNPKKEMNSYGIVPTYEIVCLDDVMGIISS